MWMGALTSCRVALEEKRRLSIKLNRSSCMICIYNFMFIERMQPINKKLPKKWIKNNYLITLSVPWFGNLFLSSKVLSTRDHFLFHPLMRIRCESTNIAISWRGPNDHHYEILATGFWISTADDLQVLGKLWVGTLDLWISIRNR